MTIPSKNAPSGDGERPADLSRLSTEVLERVQDMTCSPETLAAALELSSTAILKGIQRDAARALFARALK